MPAGQPPTSAHVFRRYAITTKASWSTIVSGPVNCVRWYHSGLGVASVLETNASCAAEAR
jgi:hypothetical protein